MSFNTEIRFTLNGVKHTATVGLQRIIQTSESPGIQE
jgi:hypothetical protein